jgi:hypothetical protein
MHQAMQRGFTVAKPFGDSAPYDMVVHAALRVARPGRLWRVQVRSVAAIREGSYRVRAWCRAGRDIAPLTIRETDFIAAWVIPLDAWYIVPVTAFSPRTNLIFYPHRHPPVGLWEHYRDAWPLLRRSALWVPTRPRRHPGPAPNAAAKSRSQPRRGGRW